MNEPTAAAKQAAEVLRDKYTYCQPCVIGAGGDDDCIDPHSTWIKIGNQTFALDGYQDKETAEWMRLMLGKAFATIINQALAEQAASTAEDVADMMRDGERIADLVQQLKERDEEIVRLEFQELALTEELRLAREETTAAQKWWIAPWVDGAGVITGSFDIRRGPKSVERHASNIVCADLTDLDAGEIAAKHNSEITDLMLDGERIADLVKQLKERDKEISRLEFLELALTEELRLAREALNLPASARRSAEGLWDYLAEVVEAARRGE